MLGAAEIAGAEILLRLGDLDRIIPVGALVEHAEHEGLGAERRLRDRRRCRRRNRRRRGPPERRFDARRGPGCRSTDVACSTVGKSRSAIWPTAGRFERSTPAVMRRTAADLGAARDLRARPCQPAVSLRELRFLVGLALARLEREGEDRARQPMLRRDAHLRRGQRRFLVQLPLVEAGVVGKDRASASVTALPPKPPTDSRPRIVPATSLRLGALQLVGGRPVPDEVGDDRHRAACRPARDRRPA